MLGARIKSARSDANFGQAEFARVIGVQPVTMYKWESGRSTPGLANLEKIAASLRVSIDWLYTGRGARSRKKAGRC